MGGCIVLMGIWWWLALKKRLTDGGSGILMWGMGVLVRLGFILRTRYYDFQHDVKLFTDPDGHAGYISYFIQEGCLPDFDVRTRWQFYHPPLHHLLTAGWMRLLTACGMDAEHVYECAKVLPFTYSCLSLAIFGMLLRHFAVKGKAFSLVMGIMAFHPAFIMLSGSINNDMLSIFLMMAALLLTCKWYRAQKLSGIILLALAIGGGMMAKLSAWLAAPAAAVVFLDVLMQHRKQPLPYLKQYLLFGIICIPLGLWWSIRNYLQYGVPIGFIPLLSDDSAQYIGNIPIWQRITDFSPKAFSYVYDCFTMYGQDYNEYNPLIGLLKTAVFEEFINTDRYPAVLGTGEVLFWTQAVLGIAAIYAAVRVCRRYDMPDDTEKLSLALTYLITLTCYLAFCLSYPHTCTQSMRYATPTIYISLLFMGIFLTKEKPMFRRMASVPAVLFMAASFLVYGVLIYI